MTQLTSNVLMQPKPHAVENDLMTTEQKYAQGILEQVTSWLQQTQNATRPVKSRGYYFFNQHPATCVNIRQQIRRIKKVSKPYLTLL